MNFNGANGILTYDTTTATLGGTTQVGPVTGVYSAHEISERPNLDDSRVKFLVNVSESSL